MTRILVADDHTIVRRGLRAILESRPGYEIVGEAADGEAAVAAALALRPDLAIIDYSLSQLNGLEVTRRLHKECPGTKVIIFTMHDSEAVVMNVMRAGARAFVLKTCADRQLLDAVSAALHHQSYFVCRGAEQMLETPTRRPHRVAESRLTERECDVVRLIAEGSGNKDISQRLNVSVKTVESHRGSIMRKIGSSSAAQVVRYAIRNNLIMA